MARLKTNAKRKINKALTRVEKVVIMDVRKSLEQQKLRGDIQVNNFLYWLLDEVKIKKIFK